MAADDEYAVLLANHPQVSMRLSPHAAHDWFREVPAVVSRNPNRLPPSAVNISGGSND